MPLAVVGVDLADDERNVRLHAPGIRVVDDRGSTGGRGRGQLARNVGAGGEERDVDTLESLGRRLADGQGPSVGAHRRPGRATGGEQPQFADRKVAFGEDLDHRSTDDAGGADDRDGQRAWFSGHGSTQVIRYKASAEYTNDQPGPPVGVR